MALLVKLRALILAQSLAEIQAQSSKNFDPKKICASNALNPHNLQTHNLSPGISMQPGQSCFSANSVPALGLHRVREDFYVLIVFVFEFSTKECKNRLRKLTYWLEILSEQWREHGFQICKDFQLGVRIKGHQEYD